MSKNKLYIFLGIACLAGYLWIGLAFLNEHSEHKKELEVCLIKHVTNVPCPSCGTTRAVLSILDGEVISSLLWNPFGILLSFILCILPGWLLYDVIKQKNSLYIFYKKAEFLMHYKRAGIPLAFLVIINWIWNISKGL